MTEISLESAEGVEEILYTPGTLGLIATSMRMGHRMTDEQRARISAAMTGKKQDPEHVEKRARALRIYQRERRIFKTRFMALFHILEERIDVPSNPLEELILEVSRLGQRVL